MQMKGYRFSALHEGHLVTYQTCWPLQTTHLENIYTNRGSGGCRKMSKKQTQSALATLQENVAVQSRTLVLIVSHVKKNQNKSCYL